jgi:N4-gp56 family major capsid protein
MQIPYSGNPLGSDASWVNPSALGTNNSTGTAVAHVLSDLTMTVKKIAAKDSLLDEEEEDAILPILPIIRDSLVTRIARKVDNTLLLSDGLTGDWAYAFAGLAKFATNASATDASVSAANGSVDATDVHKLRIKLGTYGTSPSDVIYIISVDAYYDLLNDASSGLTTVDTYGPNATLMKGEIGSLWGSKVLVSNEFAAKAQGAAWGIAVNASNFLKGELRGLNVESERTVESQKRIIVATRRIGFLQMTANKGVAAGVYGA